MTLIYRIIYSVPLNIIIRNILYPFKSIIPKSLKIPVSGVISIHNNHGGRIRFLSNETCPMTKHLYWEDKNADFEFSEIFKHLAKKADVFFDIGANIGYYSLLGASLNNKLSIFAFEPSRGARYFLDTNIKLNQFNTISIIDKACSDKTGSIEFFEEKNLKYPYRKHHASGIGNTANTWNIGNVIKYNVQATTINSVIIEKNIEYIDLIKMDTEGTENTVLEGGIESINKFQPIIICEVLENKIEDQIQTIVENKLIGYSIYQFKPREGKLIQVKNLKLQNKNLENNYFFVPQSKISLLKDFIA